MPDPFDPYREALVVEELTLWTPEARAAVDGWDRKRQKRLERRLQAEPAAAAHLEYVRVHTGFCRQVTVQPADVQRLADSTLSHSVPANPAPANPEAPTADGP